MSQQELTRLEVIQQVAAKQLTQLSAAALLNISPRQMRRLQVRYREEGAAGLTSKKRGQPSNHQLDQALKDEAVTLIKARYSDFQPTLATEKLEEVHNILLSKETVRQLMIKAGLWQDKQRKMVKIHQQRQRRAALGELVQIDGSPHAWFEDRADPCCLLVAIDDATGKLMQLHFAPVENTRAYFCLTEGYIKQHGIPLSFYHDKHGIFQVNTKQAIGGKGITQFARAMEELGIASISADSPQAKGRVERANKTLQDRLVKELRLQGISDIDSANTFIPLFIEVFNRKFAVKPRSPDDVHHTTLPDEETLCLIFSEQHERTISKNLEVSFNNVIYQIQTDTPSYSMRQAKVTVCSDWAGNVTLLYNTKALDYITFEKAHRPSLADAKSVNKAVDQAKHKRKQQVQHKPADNHPWRRHYPCASEQEALSTHTVS
jgi:transposase